MGEKPTVVVNKEVFCVHCQKNYRVPLEPVYDKNGFVSYVRDNFSSHTCPDCGEKEVNVVDNKFKNRAHMETPTEYNQRMIDRAVEEAHKKGYLDINLKVRLDASFRRSVFLEELAGVMATAEKIIKAYVEKYGRKDEKRNQGVI